MREELFHPIIVHFPIAFLVVSTILSWYLFFNKKHYFKEFVFVFRFSLYFGLFTLWLGVFSGEIALDVVRKNLLDIKVAYNHEEWAETALFLYFLSAVLEFLKTHFIEKWSWLSSKFYGCVLCLILTTGALYLGRSAHLGGQLVYEQGAAVKSNK